jgi:hypothetical protein
MAAIIFVHGIANEQMTADALEAEWKTQLGGAMRLAGHGDLADRVQLSAKDPNAIECRMAFYGDMFLERMAQGSDLEDLFENQTAQVLAEGWMRNLAERGEGEQADDARRDIAAADPQRAAAQGKGAVTGLAVRLLTKVPWFAGPTFGLATFAERALDQVTRYLDDPKIRPIAQERMLDLLGPGTKAVVAHSLGTVVAWEALCRRADRPELPLFVTLGSPLALQNVIYPRLWPQPPKYPPQVRRWVNVASKDDFVAAYGELGPYFPGGIIDGTWKPDNGAQPHNAKFYLGKVQIGRAVADALLS